MCWSRACGRNGTCAPTRFCTGGSVQQRAKTVTGRRVRAVIAKSNTRPGEGVAQLLNQLQSCNDQELRDRLHAMGAAPVTSCSTQQLRRLLAERLHHAQCEATRFPLRHACKHGPPAKGKSKSYIVVPVDIQDAGITDFMIDTGTTGMLITSALRDEIGLSPVQGYPVRGYVGDSVGGITLRQKVRLPQLRLGPHPLDIADGCVTSFQADYEPNVGGVLGLRFLSAYDVELDPAAGFIAFHPVGHVQQGIISTAGCYPVSCTPTKGGLMSISVSLNGSEPFPGILDLSATFSTINSPAAAAAQQAASGPVLDTSRVAVLSSDASSGNQTGASSSSNSTLVVRGGLQAVLGDLEKGEAYHAPEVAPVVIREVPILRVLGLQDQPAMVVGRDLVGRTRTVFSLAQGTIWIEPPRPDAPIHSSSSGATGSPADNRAGS